MKIDDATIVVRKDGPLTAAVDGEVVMFKPDVGSYFALAGVGTEIWELLADPRDVGTLCGLLLERFDVDEATCRSDVIAFVEQLRDADLVQIQTPTSP